MNTIKRLVLGLSILPLPLCVSAQTPTEVRDYPYCEVIPGVVDGSTTTQTVFNSLGFNTCPESTWVTITKGDVISAYNTQYNANATQATLNGRRHWTMDQISSQASGSVNSNTLVVNGLEFGQQGVLMSSGTVGGDPFTPAQVNRSTTYVYKAGRRVFELKDPCGTVYTMQSYSEQYYKLRYSDLKNLGKRLPLPQGWTYRARRLSSQLQLIASGSTTVVQDTLANSYQINPQQSQTLPNCTP